MTMRPMKKIIIMVLAAGVVCAAGGVWLSHPAPGVKLSADNLRYQPTAPRPSSGAGVAKKAPVYGDGLQEKVVGRWCRPDGGYVLEIRSIAADGEADAAYYNPKPIHVAKAKVSRDSVGVSVYVELLDENYPGSIYRLVYDVAADCLQGTYYQAVSRETYDIVFGRLKA